ncbi:MAG: glycoside hydrolase family 2 protein [Clostridiales bacterium]|nr:glycoside hydrolase family 2 protein [Clostridiales bacterium]
MKVLDFNKGWTFYRLSCPSKTEKVDIPHDAMFFEDRVPSNPSNRHGCWFKGDDYVYENTFYYAKEMGVVYFEFDSVYKNARVEINKKIAKTNDYGYGGFYFRADSLLNEGENVVRVTAVNSDQPNSRWYSGGGIIRPVHIYLLPEKHILFNGVKVTTTDYLTRTVKVEVTACCAGDCSISFLDGESELYSNTISVSPFGECEISLPSATLWDEFNPKLYTLKVRFFDDEREVSFGIRQVDCDALNGLRVNGNRVILRGACIHQDNGLLGAMGHPFAERRKVRLLKQAGYNAIRSAHNPASKELIDECDRLGMYVLDEYVDCWYIHKTKYDYASFCEKNYKIDLKSMVEKDYNHPSVIMYSVGNEVSESAEKRGVEFCKKMVDFIRLNDTSRPVTCGVNIFFNYLSSLGFGVYTDKKANKKEKDSPVGSEFFNMLAGKLGDKTMKLGATLRGCDKKTKDVFGTLDVAGYNYGILRYKKDVQKYPDRVILGTETFCRDAVKFMEFAKTHNAVIGDFVWAGMDYLGEVAVGSWVYKPYTKNFNPVCGWMTAGSGRIDLIGDTFGETLYTKVAFGLSPLELAVVPADKCFEKHSPSAWKMSNAMESWSFDGCENKKTIVEVYSTAHRVVLSINGKKVGDKRCKKDGITKFKVRYKNGKITVKSFDKDGSLIAKKSIVSAKPDTMLTLIPENESVAVNELCYVKVRLTDSDGVLRPLESERVKLSVEGGRLVAFGNACPYNDEGYFGDEKQTYYGSLLAIIKPEKRGEVTVKAKCKVAKVETKIKII